ncbi:MAG: hypothetical protein FWE95_11275, partial [Planctomycetaceae bacterium]|nr:hypothetical protein [Planctomycetaceae bacterium]
KGGKIVVGRRGWHEKSCRKMDSANFQQGKQEKFRPFLENAPVPGLRNIIRLSADVIPALQ